MLALTVIDLWLHVAMCAVGAVRVQGVRHSLMWFFDALLFTPHVSIGQQRLQCVKY